MGEEEDLYSGFDNTYTSSTQPDASGYSQFAAPVGPSAGFGGAGPGFGGTVMGARMGTAQRGGGGLGVLPSQARQQTAARRLGTQMGGGGGGELARPMTSVRAAGYSSAGPRQRAGGNDASQPAVRGVAPPLVKKAEVSPEDEARGMEKAVNQLLEASTIANSERKYSVALEKAKEAAKKERALSKHREQHDLQEQINLDLTYSVLFNLANQYHANQMFTEALNTYTMIVRNKQYAQSGRLRVNMGNIYFAQKNYPAAIKMYRMALDQIPHTTREVRFRILRNIGIAFARLGKYTDSISAFESIVEGCPDLQSGFNLILCHFAVGNVDNMKRAFSQLLQVQDAALVAEDDEEKHQDGHKEEDDLKRAQRIRKKRAVRYITQAAKFIAPKIEKDFVAGYDYVIEQLRAAGLTDIASEMEISKAVHFLKLRQVEKAKESLQAFERREELVDDTTTRARAATNLSFMYFLEGDLKNADKYGTLAIQADRYNAKALVNKANCEFYKGNDCLAKGRTQEARECYIGAKELYMEAIGTEADCTEAIYNLGLVKRAMGLPMEALAAFKKVHSMLPQSTECLFQMASLHEELNPPDSVKWFDLLISRVPSDSAVLARYGALLARLNDESQAYHFYNESFRYYPVDIDVISWLGAYHVRAEEYERAITFFIRASQIQPKEVKWRLMVASCYRRIGDFQQALKIYEEIEREYPDNVECLNYLVRICSDLGMQQKKEEYEVRLQRAEKRQDRTRTFQGVTQQMGDGMNRGGGGGGGGYSNMQRQSNNNNNNVASIQEEDDESPSFGSMGRLDPTRAVAEAASSSNFLANNNKLAVRKGHTEDDWGEDDVADMLPD